MAIAKTSTLGLDGIVTLAFLQDASQEDALVAAPGADMRIIVIGFLITLTVADTVIFEDEDDVSLSGTLSIGASAPFGWKGSARNPVFTLAKNKALQIQTSGTGLAGGWVKYKLVG